MGNVTVVVGGDRGVEVGVQKIRYHLLQKYVVGSNYLCVCIYVYTHTHIKI
jgi:hypothetical protein